MTPLPPRVMEYADYHHFVRDFFAFKKSQSKTFSCRRFAGLAKIKSSNFLMLVMSRRRNLSVETARDVARAMKLTAGETNFFLSLVKIERAKSGEEKLQAEREQNIAISTIVAKDVPHDKAEYLSHWYYSLVRELAFLPGFQLEPAWISKKLGGMITEAQAAKAIRVLVNLGLWSVEDGQLKVRDTFVDTGPEDRSYGEIKVVDIHKQNLIAWSKMLDRTTKGDRELGLIHIPMDGAKLPELKARVRHFQDEIIGWLQAEKSPDILVQLGTYVIKVTT